MSAIDRLLFWAEDNGLVFSEVDGGHPDDYLDILLPYLDDLILEGQRLKKRNELMMRYITKAHTMIPSNSNADLVINKLMLELAKVN